MNQKLETWKLWEMIIYQIPIRSTKSNGFGHFFLGTSTELCRLAVPLAPQNGELGGTTMPTAPEESEAAASDAQQLEAIFSEQPAGVTSEAFGS